MSVRNHDLFGINLRRIRKQQKLSRQKLAEMSKVSEFTISNIERCQVGPGLYTALQITDALGVRIEQMAEAPVTGKWIYDPYKGMHPCGVDRPNYKCSVCGDWSMMYERPYCPECGAKMEVLE